MTDRQEQYLLDRAEQYPHERMLGEGRIDYALRYLGRKATDRFFGHFFTELETPPSNQSLRRRGLVAVAAVAVTVPLVGVAADKAIGHAVDHELDRVEGPGQGSTLVEELDLDETLDPANPGTLELDTRMNEVHFGQKP